MKDDLSELVQCPNRKELSVAERKWVNRRIDKILKSHYNRHDLSRDLRQLAKKVDAGGH